MTLVLPPQLTASAESLRDAAERRGVPTTQLPTFDVPDGLLADHLLAGPTFADAVAPALAIALLEAPADWLAGLARSLTCREILAMPIAEAYTIRRPVFVKSPNDKSITARVYTDGSRLPGPDAVDPRTIVLVSDVVDFATEYRLYLLDGEVVAGSLYAEHGRPRTAPPCAEALAFGAELLAECAQTLPTAIVVDVGVASGQWAVIEANAAWASGRYAADPDRVLAVVLRAASPTASISGRDQPFIRPARVIRDHTPKPLVNHM